jgi:hypothetical protein
MACSAEQEVPDFIEFLKAARQSVPLRHDLFIRDALKSGPWPAAAD